MELDESRHTSGSCRRAFFRIASQPKSRRGRKDEEQLLKKTATFIVYYFNEPYFYADKEMPSPIICQVTIQKKFARLRNVIGSLHMPDLFYSLQAVCSCFHSSDVILIPLSGPHLESLRWMRKLRDSRCDRKLTEFDESLAQRALAILDNRKASKHGEKQENLPVLSSLTLDCPAIFQVRMNNDNKASFCILLKQTSFNRLMMRFMTFISVVSHL